MHKKTTMQKVIPAALLIVGLGALAGCSTESPTAPRPSPTPGAYSMSLSANPQ